MNTTLYKAYKKKMYAYGGSDLYSDTDIPLTLQESQARSQNASMPTNLQQPQGLQGYTNNSEGTDNGKIKSGGFGSSGGKNVAGTIIGGGASLASTAIDTFSNQDPLTGRKSVGSYAAKGAVQGAALGSGAGWIGALVGAVVGGGLGWAKGAHEKKAARADLAGRVAANRTAAVNYSASRVAGDPSLVAGYRNSNYYATGGKMPGPDPYLDIPVKNTYGVGYSGVVGINGRNPTRREALTTMAQYMQTNASDQAPNPSNVYRPQFQHYSYDEVLKKPVTYAANGGEMTKVAESTAVSAPLARAYMSGGKAKPLSSDNAEMVGNTHAEGGINIPATGAEVEDGETTKGNYVFSKKLGFADMHKPIAKAKGIVEKKPMTFERMATIKRLNGRENELMAMQKGFKRRFNLN